MPNLKESLKGTVSDAKLEHAIVFAQAPLVDLLNKNKTDYLKLHFLERGRNGAFYNFEPFWEIISEWIQDGYWLSNMDPNMPRLDFDLSKEKGSIGGICEILCDWVTSNDYLRNSAAFSTVFTDQKKEFAVDECKKLLDEISSDASFVRKERWLKEVSFHERHGHFPNDYVSCEDHKYIMTKDATTEKYGINNAVLNKSLDKIRPGYYATLYFICPGNSHAMLVRRNNNIEKSFSFFDPNCIALFDITKEEVSNTITQILKLLYFPVNINFQDIAIIERKKGASENLLTNNKSAAKSAKKEVRTLSHDSNVSMLTYKQLEKH